MNKRGREERGKGNMGKEREYLVYRRMGGREGERGEKGDRSPDIQCTTFYTLTSLTLSYLRSASLREVSSMPDSL